MRKKEINYLEQEEKERMKVYKAWRILKDAILKESGQDEEYYKAINKLQDIGEFLKLKL